LPVEVAAASITALRCGAAAPQLIWTPVLQCRWRLQIGVWRSYQATDSAGPFEEALGWPPAEWVPQRGGVEIVVLIEHRSQELVELMDRLDGRPVRVMVWTHDEISGHPRESGQQWTRITVDDLFHVTSRRAEQGFATWMASPVPSPIVDVSDVPPGV
jgi:hypothetical protein